MSSILTPTKKHWIIDIETDDLKATRIWCIVVENAVTDEEIVFTPDTINRFPDWYAAHRDDYLVGHNACSFDVPTLNRLLNLSIPLDRVVDTLVLSYLYDPRMVGGHSLEAWGERFKYPKIDFHDFAAFSDEMLTYCKQDVKLTKRLYARLTERMRKRGFSEKSAEIEHKIRVVVNKQQTNGFFFDTGSAKLLRSELDAKRSSLEIPIRELFPPTLDVVGTYKYRLTKSGTPHAVYLKHLDKFPKIEHDVENGTYDVYDWVEFNIGSPVQRVRKLLSLGWVPQKFTDKGNPQVDEESLLDFYNKSGQDEIKAIADWLVLNGRISMIDTWLGCVQDDQRIHGRVFTCGAGTRRMTHNTPNTANIPKASKKVPYGYECRSLWTVPSGRRLVGYDAKSLEMRMFAHYLGDEETAKLYIYGDPHQVNADLLGIERDPVKNVFYAFLYGAADPKLGWTGNTSLVSKREQKAFGKQIRQQLVSKTPGLDRLVKMVQAEGVFIQCIDGGYVRCEPEHARINYKLQSAGAIVMKLASIFIDQRIQERGFDALKVGDIHDEGQLDVAERDADEVGKLCVQAIRDAGEELNFTVPLDGDYKVGKSWAETH